MKGRVKIGKNQNVKNKVILRKRICVKAGTFGITRNDCGEFNSTWITTIRVSGPWIPYDIECCDLSDAAGVALFEYGPPDVMRSRAKLTAARLQPRHSNHTFSRSWQLTTFKSATSVCRNASTMVYLWPQDAFNPWELCRSQNRLKANLLCDGTKLASNEIPWQDVNKDSGKIFEENIQGPLCSNKIGKSSFRRIWIAIAIRTVRCLQSRGEAVLWTVQFLYVVKNLRWWFSWNSSNSLLTGNTMIPVIVWWHHHDHQRCHFEVIIFRLNHKHVQWNLNIASV